MDNGEGKLQNQRSERNNDNIKTPKTFPTKSDQNQVVHLSVNKLKPKKIKYVK